MIKNRVGETNKMKNGMMATIIAYIECHNIDVQFEDGVIVTHKKYLDFKRGSIGHPTVKTKPAFHYPSHKGTVIHSKKWGIVECVRYNRSNDFDICFRDYNITKHCKCYASFIKDEYAPTNNVKHLPIGATSFNSKYSQWMTVIDSKIQVSPYKRFYKVRFEDGYTTPWLQNTTQFNKGEIYNPNAYKQLMEKTYLGKTIANRNGMNMTVIKVIPSKKVCRCRVDIQFEDGTIVKNVILSHFTSGIVPHPSVYGSTFQAMTKAKELSIKHTPTGLTMKIINYRTTKDVDVLFVETGYIREHISMQCVKELAPRIHPFPYDVGMITIENPAYIYNNEGNFYCHCRKCGLSDVMSLSEIKEHIC